MPTSQFIGPILETGVLTPNYCNDCLLTAADLKADQEATFLRQVWFGQSSGYSIVDGLQVTSVESDTKLHITSGIGVNRQGKVINFQGEISLPPMPPPPDKKPDTNPGQFASLKPPATVDEKAIGVYLLTIVPTSEGYKGTAPTQMQAGNVLASSSRNLPNAAGKWVVERIRFKIIRLADSDLTELYSEADLQGIKVNDDNRRNLVAHWCYGTLTLQNLGSDPFSFRDQYGDFDPLALVTELTADDIPLATFHWSGAKLTFVDMWSVRRRIIRPDAHTGTWKALVSDKRIAANQARFLQFQDHVDHIVQRGKDPKQHIDLSKAKLTDYFTFLPPVGFLPTTTSSVLTHISQVPGSSGAGIASTQTGAFSDLWNTITSGIGNLTKLAFNPQSRLNVLHVGMSTQEATMQNMQRDIATLYDLFGAIQKAASGATSTTTEGESAESEDHTNETTKPLNKQGQELQSPEIPPTVSQMTSTLDQLFRDQVVSLLSSKQNAGSGNFDLAKSFAGTPVQLQVIGSDSITSILHQSWYQDAIDLRPGSIQNQSQMSAAVASILSPATNVYLVEENLRHPTNPVYTIFHKAI